MKELTVTDARSLFAMGYQVNSFIRGCARELLFGAVDHYVIIVTSGYDVDEISTWLLFPKNRP